MRMFQNINRRWENDPRPLGWWAVQMIRVSFAFIMMIGIIPASKFGKNNPTIQTIEKFETGMAMFLFLLTTLCIIYKLNAPEVPNNQNNHRL